MKAARLAFLLPLIVASPLAAQVPVFRGAVDAVLIDVAVRERGRPVPGLTVRDFAVSDNGVPQAILDVTRETLPIDVRLIVDLSGSLEGPPLEAVRRALGDVALRLRPSDRSSLVVFDQRVREISGFRPGRLGIVPEALRSPQGLTALIDAMAASIVVPIDPDRRRMAIVFTDGNDITSFLDEQELVDLAIRSDVAVFSVTLTDGTLRVPQKVRNAPLLQTLANATGGVLTVLQRDEDLGAAFVRAFDEFRTRYVLRYVPTAATGHGWHAVSVRVTRPSRADVQARRGYFDGAPAAVP